MKLRRRLRRDSSFLMKLRMPSLDMLRITKQSPTNLILLKMKLRRSRRCSTLKQQMLTSRKDKISSRRAQTQLMDYLLPSMLTWQPCLSPSLRTKRRSLPKKSRLSKPSLKLLILRKHPEPCSLRTELPGPWTSRKTLQPSWKSSRDVQPLNKHSCPKETRFPLMPRPSRMSLPGSPSTSQNSRPTPRLSATNTPMMSSSGLSTELVSRSSAPGWLELKRLLAKVCPSHQILLKSRL